MFVATGRVGQTAFREGPPAQLLDAASIARFAAEGALFGAHLAHRPIEGLSAEALARELAVSYAMLGRRLGALAAQIGYRIGLGEGKGKVRLGADKLNLPRILVSGNWTFEHFIHCMGCGKPDQ